MLLPLSAYQAKAKGFLGTYSMCKPCDYAAKRERLRPAVEARAAARQERHHGPGAHERKKTIIRERVRAKKAAVRSAALEAMSPEDRAASLARARPTFVMPDGRRRVMPVIPESWCANCAAIFRPRRKDRTLFCSRVCALLKQGEGRRAKGLPKLKASPHSNGGHRRRARRFGCLYEAFSPIDIFNRDGWTCQECGKPTPRSSRGLILDDAPTLDHYVPLALRGPHTPANTRCLCLPCNLKKGAQPPS